MNGRISRVWLFWDYELGKSVGLLVIAGTLLRDETTDEQNDPEPRPKRTPQSEDGEGKDKLQARYPLCYMQS